MLISLWDVLHSFAPDNLSAPIRNWTVTEHEQRLRILPAFPDILSDTAYKCNQYFMTILTTFGNYSKFLLVPLHTSSHLLTEFSSSAFLDPSPYATSTGPAFCSSVTDHTPSVKREGYTLKTRENLFLLTMLVTANMKDAPLLGIPSMSPIWSTFFSSHVTAESTPDLSTIPDDDPFAFDTSATPRLSLRHQATFSPDSSVIADDDPPQFCPLYFSFCCPFD